MEKKIELNQKVFAENFAVAKKAFILNSNLEAAACATAFIGNNTPTTAEAMKEAKRILDKNTSILSSVGHSNCRQVVTATLAQSRDPEHAITQIKKIHKGLDKKFFNSDYLVLAATMLYRSCRESDYDTYIKRTREIYTLIRKDHPFITGREDITNCVIMALTDVDTEVIANNAEACFTALKKHFISRDKIQYMSCIASCFGGDPEDKAKAIRDTYDMFKSCGVRFDSEASSVIAATAMLVRAEDRKTVIKRISKLSDDLKSIRGMGPLGVGKRMRHTLACAIVLEAYTGGDSTARNGVINAIISAIIAIEVAAMIAAVTAASAASSSAH